MFKSKKIFSCFSIFFRFQKPILDDLLVIHRVILHYWKKIYRGSCRRSTSTLHLKPRGRGLTPSWVGYHSALINLTGWGNIESIGRQRGLTNNDMYIIM